MCFYSRHHTRGYPLELNFWRNASGTGFIGLYMQMVDIAKMYDRQWSEEAPSRFAAAPPTYDLADRVASPAVLKALGRHADIKTTMQSYVNLEHLEARGVLDTLRLLSNPDRRGPIGPTPGREASRGTPSGYPNDPESDGFVNENPHLAVTQGGGRYGSPRPGVPPMGFEDIGAVRGLDGQQSGV